MSDGIYSSLLGNCKELLCACRESERWVEREDKDGECARGMEEEENKEVRSENHYGGIRSGEIIHEPVKMWH